MQTSDLEILTDTVDGMLYRIRKMETELKLIQLTLKQFKGKTENEKE